MEIFNEFFVLFDCYFLFLFTDFVDDYDATFNNGWYLSTLIGLILVINVLIHSYMSIVSAIFSFKMWRAKRNLAQQRAKLSELKKDSKEEEAREAERNQEEQRRIERRNWRI